MEFRGLRHTFWAVLLTAGHGFAESAAPTFAEDIAPILFERCIACHRPGEVAPMSLMSYPEVRPWARAIAREVESRRMPPFHAESSLGFFANDPRLTEEQVSTIVAWSQAGAPRGDLSKLPALPELPNTGWQLGEPDVIISFPRVTLGGVDDEEFPFLYSMGRVKESFWFRAIELKTEQRSLLHHANVFVTHEDEVVPDEGGFVPYEEQKRFRLFPMLTWLPGLEPRQYPAESPGRLTEGFGLVVDSHYIQAPGPCEEQIQLGFYGAEGPVVGYNKTLGVDANDILLRPGQKNYVKTFRLPFEEDSIVTGFHTHLHERGIKSRTRFIYPDGRIETLLNIPKWDAAWQRDYTLTEPMIVPKGTIAEFRGEWDNSADNPANPDPTAVVRLGPTSADEMFHTLVYYRSVEPLNPPIYLDNGREIEADSGG